VDVFLFDEPLSNLDAKLRSELRVEIKRLHHQLNNTMIYVTHDQIEALTLADRIAIMKSGVIQQLDDPMTIYNEPMNLFVAGFIGSPAMNFLHGTLAQGADGLELVTQDVRIPVAGYKAKTPMAAGQKVVMGLRPEHIRVDDDTASAFFNATVDIEEPMGADNLLWLKFAGKTVSVRIAGSRRYQPGSQVRLSLDMSLASLFDETSELRI
jgi:multiple sugar transport system ATP-binding protein